MKLRASPAPTIAAMVAVVVLAISACGDDQPPLAEVGVDPLVASVVVMFDRYAPREALGRSGSVWGSISAGLAAAATKGGDRFDELLDQVGEDGPVEPFVALGSEARADVEPLGALIDPREGTLDLPATARQMSGHLIPRVESWLAAQRGAREAIGRELGPAAVRTVTTAAVEAWRDPFRARLLTAAANAGIGGGGLGDLDGRLLADVALLHVAASLAGETSSGRRSVLRIGLDGASPARPASIRGPFGAAALFADHDFSLALIGAVRADDPVAELREAAPDRSDVAREHRVVAEALARVEAPGKALSAEGGEFAHLLRADLVELVEGVLDAEGFGSSSRPRGRMRGNPAQGIVNLLQRPLSLTAREVDVSYR